VSGQVAGAALHRSAELFDEFVEFFIAQPERKLAKADSVGC
jgi:hypothetical protein